MAKANDVIDHGTGGGSLCLDFANTVDWHASDHPEETLSSYEDLVEWSRRQGLVTTEGARRLAASVKGSADQVSSVLKDARELREAIYRLFSDAWHGRQPAKKDLGTLNACLSKGMSRARVTGTDGHFQWGWDTDDLPPDVMLWPIARSAAELLTSEEVHQVKECANDEEGCGWLFLDTSRSGNRVWCSMKSCGNRAKFRAYYDRHNRAGQARRGAGPRAS